MRVKVIVSVDGTAQDSQFDGLLSVRFKGYANTVTGALRTLDGDGIEFPNLNVERDYQSGKSDLILPDDLATNEAYTLEIYPKFSLIAAQNKVADGSLISIALDLFEEAGVYSELGQALGDWLYPSDDRGYVVPDDGLAAIALKRSGIVASTSFLKVGASPLYGLDIDAAGQKAAINGDGAIYLRDGALQPAEALRAILGTVAGDSKPCAWSLPITTSGTQAVQVTCTYPSNGTTATIRADYPDAIAGVTGKAKFNPPLVTLFLTDGSEIRRFEGFSVVDGGNARFLNNQLELWGSNYNPAPIRLQTSACFVQKGQRRSPPQRAPFQRGQSGRHSALPIRAKPSPASLTLNLTAAFMKLN